MAESEPSRRANSRSGRQDSARLPQHQTKGNCELDEGPRVGIRQPQLSAKFPGALFHASNANSDTVRLQFGNSLIDSLAIVPHGNHDVLFFLSQGDLHLASFGMPEDIG